VGDTSMRLPVLIAQCDSIVSVEAKLQPACHVAYTAYIVPIMRIVLRIMRKYMCLQFLQRSHNISQRRAKRKVLACAGRQHYGIRACVLLDSRVLLSAVACVRVRWVHTNFVHRW
jgi:hypothetical protein